MRAMTILILLAISPGLSADIYKCKQPDGKTVYQSTQCREMKDLGAVEIKNDRSSTDTMEGAYNKQEDLREKDDSGLFCPGGLASAVPNLIRRM